MSSIKFNQLTKEIELRGSESFIESNYDKIQDLLVESFGVKRMTLQMQEFQTVAEIERQEVSEPPQIPLAAKSSIPAVPPTIRVNRPPLRKYIRKEGMPGQQRVVVEVVDQRPSEISIASLKEKFGLSESKISGIIRDAEKLGKVKRATDGSYVWS